MSLKTVGEKAHSFHLSVFVHCDVLFQLGSHKPHTSETAHIAAPLLRSSTPCSHQPHRGATCVGAEWPLSRWSHTTQRCHLPINIRTNHGQTRKCWPRGVFFLFLETYCARCFDRFTQIFFIFTKTAIEQLSVIPRRLCFLRRVCSVWHN